MNTDTWERRYADLLRVLSHDLHAPVRQLESFKTLLKHTGKWNEEQKEYFAFIESALDRLNLRTKRIQALSNALNMPLEYERLDVHEMIESTAMETLEGYGAPIRIKVCVNGSSLVSSRALLSSIVGEIVLNAQQHANSHNAGSLSIKVESNQINTKLLFQDTGPGIKEEWLEKALQPMVRLTDNVDLASAGIGLTLVQLAVERLGGEVSLHNQCGLVVELNLPHLSTSSNS